MTTKITTTPNPLEVIDKINVLVDESSTNATNITSSKNASITGLSVSGKVITYTKGNGTTGTITTQDTTYTHPNSGVTAGTYRSVTVNAQGHVTAGSNPASGYHTGNATSIGDASATKPAVVVTSYRSGASWYRVWSDGWLEQGGQISTTTKMEQDNTITFHKAFKDTNYTIVHNMGLDGSAKCWYKEVSAYSLTTTNAITFCAGSSSRWYACGQGA